MSDLELKIMPFKPGMELKVKGVPKPKADRFSINVGNSRKNIALHFSPRFNYEGDKRVIVLNSMKDGCWHDPVKETDFHLQWGQEFEVTIIFADDKFYIRQPNCEVLQFPNHLADKQYDYILIDGEVTIKSIYVN